MVPSKQLKKKTNLNDSKSLITCNFLKVIFKSLKIQIIKLISLKIKISFEDKIQTMENIYFNFLLNND